MNRRNEELAKITKDLMFKEPHYGLFLIMLNKRWDASFPTAAVALNGINYELILGEKFWDKLSDIQRIGVLKHELAHIGFHHLTEFGHLTDKELKNIAMDKFVPLYSNI